jgi:hypothetical protein
MRLMLTAMRKHGVEIPMLQNLVMWIIIIIIIIIIIFSRILIRLCYSSVVKS